MLRNTRASTNFCSANSNPMHSPVAARIILEPGLLFNFHDDTLFHCHSLSGTRKKAASAKQWRVTRTESSRCGEKVINFKVIRLSAIARHCILITAVGICIFSLTRIVRATLNERSSHAEIGSGRTLMRARSSPHTNTHTNVHENAREMYYASDIASRITIKKRTAYHSWRARKERKHFQKCNRARIAIQFAREPTDYVRGVSLGRPCALYDQGAQRR